MVCLYLLGLDAEGRGSAEPDFLCTTGRVIGIRAYVNIDCLGGAWLTPRGRRRIDQVSWSGMRVSLG